MLRGLFNYSTFQLFNARTMTLHLQICYNVRIKSTGGAHE